MYANGAKFEGFFENGERNGFGKFTRTDGAIFNGCWEKGGIIKEVTVSFEGTNFCIFFC